ncbi:MAG: T9SS type A sorting domain-containing protein [Bacteroidota bacterium]
MPKKLSVLFCLLLFCLTGQSQTHLTLSPSIPVANPGQYDNLRPQIALSNGNPLIIWGSTIAGRKGWVARYNGSAFDTPVEIHPSGQINAFGVEGPNIDAKGDTAYLAFTSYFQTGSESFIRASFDGGQTWGDATVVDSLSGDFPSFTNVTVGSGGNPLVYYIRQQSNWANPRYVLRSSTDAGQTFAAEVDMSTSVAPGNEVCDCCQGHLYPASGGRLVSVFRNNDSNLRDQWAGVSTDGGLTWVAGIDLDSTDWIAAVCPSSGPESYILGDSIYTIFMSRGGPGGYARVWLGTANLTTQALGYNRMLFENVANNETQNYPAIAGNGDTIGAVWTNNAGGDVSIWMTHSVTGSGGMFENLRLNLTDGESGTQTTPSLAFHNGTFHISWRDDATGNVMYRTATVQTGVSAPEPTAATFTLAPNPATDAVRLHFANPLQAPTCVTLHDAQGRLVRVYDGVLKESVEVERGDLGAGVYFVRCGGEVGKVVFH